LPALVLATGVYLLKDYFIPGLQIILGMMVAPFVFRIKEKGVFSNRYAFVSAVFMFGYCFLHIYMLLFFAIGCLLFFTIESRLGKIGILPFLFLICICPAMHYIVNTFTFSIRLALSKYAAIALNTIGIPVTNHGNYFVLSDGFIFSVDTACIGLNMFNTGLCLVILMLGFAAQRSRKDLNIFFTGTILAASVVLLILTNFLRIIGLVFFKSMPETIGHDMIGIFSLILYMAVPVYFLINFLVKKFGNSYSESNTEHHPVSFPKQMFATVSLCICLVASGYFVNYYDHIIIKDEKLAKLELAGFSRTIKEDGVIEFRKGNILIYVKPANKAYESDHPPNMCWQGSGFHLEEINESKCGSYTIMTATLKKDELVQYTAWWYDNGSSKTISQWEWRTSSGEPYRTINITTNNKEELNKLCNAYLKKKLF
jgi:exosortase N